MRPVRSAALLLAMMTLLVPSLDAQPSAGFKSDAVLDAMRAELKRSRNLRLVSMDEPYFIEYVVDDGESLSIDATLGALVSKQRTRMRVPRIEVRIGNYDLDNTNYVFSDFFSGHGRGLGVAPLGNDVLALRTHLWIATDLAYKGGLAALARKRAALKSVNLSSQLSDFTREKAVVVVRDRKPQEPDEKEWTARVKRLSALYADYSTVTRSSVHFESLNTLTYLGNSEGSLIRFPENLHYLRVRARSQAPDGMPLRDAVVIARLNLSEMPAGTELEREVRAAGDNLTALRKAPVGESYTGPVLFAGQAASQLFAQLLGRNLAIPRRPVPEPQRPLPFEPSPLEGRIGSRVLPEWMSVLDDPTQTEWRGQPLLGSYPVDNEGVVPRPLELIANGILKQYLLTRQPVKGFSHSNGRARLPGRFGANTAVISNLFVTAAETVTEDGLEKKLIEMCEQRGKPYGILIRKLDYPSSASLGELRRMSAGSRGRGGAHGLLGQPVLAYRVYPDGREELIRGMRFRDLSVRALRDIVAASDESHLFSFLYNTAPLALMGAGGYVTSCSVVAPSILIEDIDLNPDLEEMPKLPVVPPPNLGAPR